MTAVASPLAEYARIGIVQTTLDHRAAWAAGPSMHPVEEARAIEEIRRHVSTFYNQDQKADVILFPELSVPLGFEGRLRRIANKLGSVIIAGLDYQTYVQNPLKIGNNAIVIVPTHWRGKRIARHSTVRYVGKTYPAPAENVYLKKLGASFRTDGTVWVFDGGAIGSFGVAICYDFIDLDRLAMYRGQLQHLFILAYNKDTMSFDHAAETVSRAVFCNVVVCNCGFFGGSVALSPYHGPERRTIYRASGAKLGNAQTISLPVRSLAEHQQAPKDKEFKSLPPGYPLATHLSLKSTPL